MRFEDLKQGDKLTLRDDLEIGGLYGNIMYREGMLKPNTIVTFVSRTPSNNICVEECRSDFVYSPEMFKVSTTKQKENNIENLVGTKLKCVKAFDEDFTVGRIYEIKEFSETETAIFDDENFAWSGYNDNGAETIESIINYFLKNTIATFEVVVESTKPKTTKTKTTKPKSNQPIIETNGSDTYIFCGNNTIYINEEFGVWGMSTKHPNDKYDKRIAKAVSYYNAFEERNK